MRSRERESRTHGHRLCVIAFGLSLAVAKTGFTTTWQERVGGTDLPLTIVDTAAPRAFLVLFTGDGGWQAVDRTLAEGLAPHGVATLGWSTLRYFATRQEPSHVMNDLRHVLDALRPEGLPIYVGGYSFGAEVPPVVLAQHATRADRDRVAGLLLLGPSASASFRIDPLDWVREPTPDPRHLVTRAVRDLAPMRTVCIAGRDDATAICGELRDVPGAAVARVPGTHHFENGMPRAIDAAVRLLFDHRREGR